MSWVFRVGSLLLLFLVSGCSETKPIPLRACRAKEIRLQTHWGAALGSYGGSWRFVNEGPAECVLVGPFRGELLDETDHVLLHAEVLTRQANIRLAPNHAARAIVLWSNWCEPTEGPFRIEIALAAGGVFIVPVPGHVGCTSAEAESHLSIEGFLRDTPEA